MKKQLNLNPVLPCVSAFFLIFLVLGVFLFSSLTYASGKTNRPIIKTNEPPLKVTCQYEFILTPPKEDKADEYSRLEIENFLCAMAENFIVAEMITRYNISSNYYIPDQETLTSQKPRVEQCEILKWFEDRVTVTSKGTVSARSENTIRAFYQRVNQIIGQEKFIYQPQLAVANIIIQLEENLLEEESPHYLGETSLLQDNLRTRLGINDGGVYLDIYTIGNTPVIVDSKQISFTPEELQFRTTNRLVKVYLNLTKHPRMQHFSLVHELMHTLGFCGHSPFLESFLFPYPVDCYTESIPNLSKEPLRLTGLAERAIEMLYRPELLPGMTLKQATPLLSRLKLRALTPDQEIIATLNTLNQELIENKKQLLAKGKENYDRNLNIMLLQGQLELKELALLTELKEIKVDYKLSPQVIETIQNARTPLEKMTVLRRELAVHEYHKNRLTALLQAVKGNQQRDLRRQLKPHQLQIVVINDIIALQKDIDAAAEKLENVRQEQKTWELEESLRQTERQLIILKEEIPKRTALH